MDIKIIVATHKDYQMPTDSIYLPLLVGAQGKKTSGFLLDNTGDNISDLNPIFSELTGLYWAWKNLDYDYLGLCHYRRYFTYHKIIPRAENKKFTVVLSRQETEKLLENTDIILPKKRRYFIENMYSHYKHTMYIEPLNQTRKVIEEKYPDYLEEFDRLHKRTSAHMFNMMIMKKEYCDEYCQWLFDILFELEKRVDSRQYNAFHAKYAGRIAELLLDVWINTNNLSYKEVKVINTQNSNYFKKGLAFMKAKFFNTKYEQSF